MIQFFVNNVQIHSTDIWYKYNKNRYLDCKDTYTVTVPISNIKVIKELELEMDQKLTPSFVKENIPHSWQNSLSSLVKIILDEENEKSSIEWNLYNSKWVFYDIQKMSVENNKLIITGTAAAFEKQQSPVLLDF